MSREMKDSGVEWIGEIPEDWDIERCKYNFAYHKDIAGMDSINYERLALTMRGVIKRAKEDTDGLQPESFDGYQIANEGDLIFKLIDLAGKSTSRVGLSPYTGLVSPAYILLHANDKKMSKEYAQYFFLSMWYRLIFNQIGNGGIRSSLNATDLLEVPITTPKLTEQTQIVHFLDRKCTAIDTAIEKTKESIEKLEEYKKAVITKAVTKGIDPNAKMKDSGVEWIGEVPETWDTLRIKHSSWLKGRIGWDGLKSEEFIDDGPYLITGTDFNDGIVNWDTCVHITEDRYNEDKLLHVYNGDLLITKDGTVGKLAIITNAPDKVSLNSGVMIIRNNSKFKYDQQYMFYVLKSDVFTKWFDHHKKPGSTIQHLYQHQFDDFRYPFPSLAEQKNIAAYLEEKCMAIDALIVKKQEAISKLEEYKKSLIYYAVTGKIDCRNEAV